MSLWPTGHRSYWRDNHFGTADDRQRVGVFLDWAWGGGDRGRGGDGVMANKIYSLENDTVVSRQATPEELSSARNAALELLRTSEGNGYAMRSCWNCNSAHRHFLNDVNDKFLFTCMMGCGRWYYQGIDITKCDDPTVSQDVD